MTKNNLLLQSERAKLSAQFSLSIGVARGRYYQQTIGQLCTYVMMTRIDELGASQENDGEIQSQYAMMIETLAGDGDSATPSFDNFTVSLIVPAMVAEVELFLTECIKAVIRRVPEKINGKQIKAEEALACANRDELLEKIAARLLYEIGYLKPMDYLKHFCELTDVPQDAIKKLWAPYVEIKARRDLGVHGNWIANDVYNRKVKDAGHPEVANGTSLIPDSEYLEKAQSACTILVQEVANLLTEKFGLPSNTRKRAKKPK